MESIYSPSVNEEHLNVKQQRGEEEGEGEVFLDRLHKLFHCCSGGISGDTPASWGVRQPGWIRRGRTHGPERVTEQRMKRKGSVARAG